MGDGVSIVDAVAGVSVAIGNERTLSSGNTSKARDEGGGGTAGCLGVPPRGTSGVTFGWSISCSVGGSAVASPIGSFRS